MNEKIIGLKLREDELTKDYEKILNDLLTLSRKKTAIWIELEKTRKRILELMGIEARGE